MIQHLGPPYRAVALSTHSRVDQLIEQTRRLRPVAIAVTGESDTAYLRSLFGQMGVECFFGPSGLIDLVQHPQVDIVLSAVVGAAGLPAAVSAVDAGKKLLLANKEALVIAGSLLIPRARQRQTEILPIDSEHSAVFQAMQAGRRQEIRRVILTASGGPFRKASLSEMENARPRDALRHPTWNMGEKITIDSATMFNKAAEIIEAAWLFDLEPDQIEVVIHPESVIHSMVEFVDGSVIAQLSPPDMKTPIQYAITYPERLSGCGKRMDWTSEWALHFEPPDPKRFPALSIAYEVIRVRGTLGAVMNAANETAVSAFLAEKIRFGMIWRVVENTIAQHHVILNPTLDDLLQADQWARRTAEAWIRRQG
ncbi:MAG: 1-deoxy-D-xylulose 5-phosphate reductoisomerase [Phycisphaerae bacterium]|nr:MAG: 1-deoxy-D-xylulose 5-phosphate reductoisomerase [Phycisphaerae bacterium]